MNNWLIALLPLGGAVAALLGIFIQIIYSKSTEDKKRRREVREKRIDKVEDFINYLFKNYWTLLTVHLELSRAKENDKSTVDSIQKFKGDMKSLDEYMTKSIKHLENIDNNDISLFTVGAYSLHDKEIDNLLKETWEFEDELKAIRISIPPSHNPQEIREVNKAVIEKLLLLKDTFKKLLIGFYNRLDYLRTK